MDFGGTQFSLEQYLPHSPRGVKSSVKDHPGTHRCSLKPFGHMASLKLVVFKSEVTQRCPSRDSAGPGVRR